MLVNVYHSGQHTVLNCTPADTEELVMRCGWTVIHQIEATEAERTQIDAEIMHIENKGFAESLTCDTASEAIAWWNARKVSSEPCLTPDI